NVLNTGLIDNLPQTGVVEVACLVDRNGVQPCHFGPLPEHLAALNRSNMAFFELAVTAVLEKDRSMAERALMIDPLTAAVCSLDEIRAMFNELYEAEKDLIAELR
ncbi:MAG: alpha-glucosidase/alpha-galactosidase, partial [Firmicutes bacterium]|nr:alpha-glucosidase/alpha-galactosidase [Bacillota bacterium]